MVKGWPKKDEEFIQVTCPAVIMKFYNSKMRGDMIDRLISYYQTKAIIKK